MPPDPGAPTPGPLHQICYVSRSLAQPGELAALQASSVRRNRAHGLTGVLLFSGGHFLQWLEGPPAAVQATFAAIGADDRHTGLRVLRHGPLGAPRFRDWAMAWVEAPGADDLLRGLLSAPQVPPERLDRLLALLTSWLPPQDER